jgi:hypothetical protein
LRRNDASDTVIEGLAIDLLFQRAGLRPQEAIRMRKGRRFTLLAPGLLLALGTLSGCPSRDVSAVLPNQSKEQQKEIPVTLNRNIDILWVIDNSGSMEQEQVSLARNFPEFVRVLEGIEGGLPDIHMGVVSSDMGTAPHDIDAKCEDSDNGVLQVLDCPALDGGVRYIEDISTGEEGGRQRNYTGDLADQFSCMAQLGINGCGFEQHLGAMKAALENTDENAGFLRDDAFLAVIFIQDEDDCSTFDNDIFGGAGDDDRDSEFGEYSSFRCFEYGTDCEPSAERETGPRDNCVPADDSPYIEPVATYVDFLRNLKDSPNQVIVAEVTGPTEPVIVGEDPDSQPRANQLWVEPACVVCPGGGDDCSASFGSEGEALVAAAPSIRMKAFLDGFPQRSTFQSICNYNKETDDVDLSGALTQIALLLKRVVGNPCIEGNLADSNPNQDGRQVECKVSDVRDLDLETEEEFPIASCDDSGSAPCFRLAEDPSCGTETNIALEIDRGEPPQDPPPNTTVVARCLVE